MGALSLFASLVSVALLSILVTYDLSAGMFAFVVCAALLVFLENNCKSNERSWKMLSLKKIAKLVGLVVCIIPMFAMADAWDQTLVATGRSIRIGMYLIAGTLSVITVVWSGGQWLLARANGDHSHSFLDYLKQLAVVGAVGAGIGLAAWAWGIFGTGNPT